MPVLTDSNSRSFQKREVRHEWEMPVNCLRACCVFNVGQLAKLVGFLCADKTGIDLETSLNL